MKILSPVLSVVGVLLLFAPAKANHILGGNISWECLGGGQYEITLVIYKDCFGATAATPDETLFFFPGGCSLPFSADAPFVSEVEISDLCPQELVNSSCSGGLIPGTQVLTYSVIVTLDTGCPWTVSWAAGDWNYFVNLDTSSLPTAYFESTIDPTAGCFDSGVVTTSPVPYYCSGDAVNFDFDFTPPPGSTYVTTLTGAQTDLGASALYQPGYTSFNPIPGFVFDPLTGEMSFNAPFIPGSYVVCLQIDIYDGGGNLVGTMLESMTFIVRFCFPTPTEFTDPGVIAADPGVNIISGTELSVCAGGLLCFDVEATNTNVTKAITLTSDFTTVFPLGTFVQTGLNPATGVSCVQTDESMIGDYVVTYYAIDNACIFPDDDLITITIHIMPNLSVSSTGGIICYGDTFNVTATGDTQFQWNVLSGDADPEFGCLNCGGQSLTPDSSTVVEVIALNAPAYCNTADTITVNVSLSPISAVISNETCNGNDGAIDLTIWSGTGNYSFTWDIPYFLEDPSGLQDGTYQVNILDTGLPGCSLDTSFTLTSAPPPSGFISGDTTICAGQSADILFNLDGTGPFNITMTPPGPALANDGDIYVVSPLTTTTYTLDNFSDSNIPSCTYNIPSSVIVTVLPLVNANFLAPATICSDDTLDLEIEIDQPGNYEIIYTIDGVTQPGITATDGDMLALTPTATTTYNITSVSYSSVPFCANPQNNPVTVTVNDLPGAALSGAIAICAGGNTDLVFDFTGTGPWQVDFEAGGVAVVLPVINTAQWIYNVTPNATTTYCITGVTDLGVNCFAAINSCQEITVNPVPAVVFSQNDVICPGDAANLTIDLTSTTGLFNVVIQSDDGTSQNNILLNNLADPYVYADFPMSNTTYTLVSVEYSDNPGQCTITPGDVITITVVDSPTALIVDTLCALNAFSYQVVIQISGGDPASYSITPSTTGPGTLVGDLYTSDFVTSGFGESWAITDINDCSPVTLTIDPYACPIVTYSGTMLSDTAIVCGNNPAITTWNNDGVFDGFDDQLMFVMHDSPTQIIGQIYAIDCNDSGFNDGDTPLVFGNGPGEIEYGVVYYVSAVVGDDDGSGDCVNLGALNVSISIGQPVVFYEEPVATMSGGGLVCAGDTTAVQIDFTAGQAPWTISYTIDGVLQPEVSTSDSPYSLPVSTTGSYNLVSVNSLGCGGTAAGNANVIVNPLPTATISADGAFCQGQTYDLNIDFTGLAPWDFVVEFDDGFVVQTIAINNNLNPSYLYTVSAPGTYSVQVVTDDNGCTNPDNPSAAVLTMNELPMATFAFNDTSYCEGSSLDLIVNLDGLANWNITWSLDGGPDQNWISTDTVFTQQINTPGNYNLSAVTDNNCTQALNENIVVVEVASPVSDAGPDLETCSGIPAMLGTANLVGQSYEWDNAQYLDNALVAQPLATVINDGISDTLVTFVMTAMNLQCPLNDTVVLTVHPLPTADAGANDTLCYGGVYTLQGSGGLIYNWVDNGFFIDPIQSQNPQVQPDITTTFYLQVEDVNFCVASDSVIITVPTALIVDEVFDNQVCFGLCSATLVLTPSGSIPPYTVSWSSALTGLVETAVCPGIYDYVVSDSVLCTVAGTIQIDELADYFIDDVLIVPSICFGESSGSIQVTDVDAVMYTNAETAEMNQTGYFPDLPAGVYNLSVINADGCIADTAVAFGSVSGPIDIVPDFEEQQVCYLDTVSFSALAAGGSGNFTYNWYNCESVDSTCDLGLGDPLQIEITQDTTLYVVAYDDNGCPSEPVAMWVHFNPEIFMNVGPDDVVYICQEECVDLETGAAGGNGNISVEWTDATDPLNTVFITDTYTTTQCPMDTALYVVTGTDGCNPPGIDSVLVIVWPKPEAIMEVSETEGCFPITIDFMNLTDAIYQDNCLWLLGTGSQLGVCSDFSYTYSIEGEYWPSLTVTTQYGCTDTDSLDVPIEIHGYPEASFTWEPQPVTVLENEVQFIDLSTGDVAWIWDFGGFGQDNVENPVFEFPDVDLWNYPICLEVINEFGCIDTACRTLVMGPILLVYVPNAFTPDDDDVNDYFLPYVRGFEPGSYKLFIYDRWGNRIFYTEDVDQPWTCNVRDGEYYAQNDVYVWRIELKELGTAAEKIFSGHVTVVR